MKGKNRLETYRELVHIVIKDITWIGTKISKDGEAINIKVVFGNECVTIPIKVEDIEKNSQSAKDFFNLIKPSLENILKEKL